MAGKDFSQLERREANNAQLSTQTQHLSGLLSNTRKVMEGMTPVRAFEEGITLHTALRMKRQEVKVLLLAELERLVRHLNATRTFQTQTDLQDAVDDICEVFPTMKLEEILTAFKYIRQGRYELYGNFTTNVMLDCLRKYEDQNTITMREQKHEQVKREVMTTQLDIKRLIRDLEKDGKLKDPRKKLDRTFIPYPNAKTDYYTGAQQTHKTTEETRTQGDEERPTQTP